MTTINNEVQKPEDATLIVKRVLNAPPERVERQEFPALAAGVSKRLESPSAKPARPHGVIKQPNLDPLFGLLAKQVQHCPPSLVRLENERLQMNVMAGRGDRFTNGFVGRDPFMIKTNQIAPADGKGAEPRGQSAHAFPKRVRLVGVCHVRSETTWPLRPMASRPFC